MKKSKKRLFLFIPLILLIILAIALYASAPKILEHYVNKDFAEACSHCELKLGSVGFSILYGNFDLGEVEVKFIEKDRTELTWKIKKLKGSLSLYKLLRGQVEVSDVEMRDPFVELLDGDAPAPPDDNKAPSDTLLAFRNIQVINGEFNFFRKDVDGIAKLHIQKINASIDAIGDTPELKSHVVHCVANGQIESSGRVDLKIESAVLEKPLKMDIDIKAGGQDLSDLTNFFKQNDGLTFKGHLIEGTGHVRLVGKNITTSVYSKFQGFDVKFNKIVERSAVMAFFMNLGRTIVFDEKNTDKDREKQTRVAEITQKPNESVVSFILRSLQEAAIKVVKVK